MEIKKIAYFPFRTTRKMWNSAKKPSYNYVSDYVAIGATAGAVCGSAAGAAAGLVTPLYIGWRFGEYISDKLNLPGVVSFTTDLVTSCTTAILLCGITVPAVAFAGGIGIAVIGAGAGTLIGVGKKGLEAVVSKVSKNKED